MLGLTTRRVLDDDDISFTALDGVTVVDMEKWDVDDIDGFILGNAGADHLEGSNSAQSGFDETLFGQRGNDILRGNIGADILIGNDGDDIIEGGRGADTLWGGDGDDSLYGDDGNDSLCDASGYDVCASNEGNFFDGGEGDDQIWYNESENPAVPCPNVLMDQTSTCGPVTDGNDRCGDNSNYLTTDLCINTDSFITLVPTRCVGAH